MLSASGKFSDVPAQITAALQKQLMAMTPEEKAVMACHDAKVTGCGNLPHGSVQYANGVYFVYAGPLSAVHDIGVQEQCACQWYHPLPKIAYAGNLHGAVLALLALIEKRGKFTLAFA